ncbi:CDC48 family AAA ATPase [Rugosimonospora acidiphila]|uniref:CDC48 family AAA ATPase n=1 Tax=Rugosimonospora acidiphila TaxID=556531 RepID=A0ABP9S4Q5_9ACTN
MPDALLTGLGVLPGELVAVRSPNERRVFTRVSGAGPDEGAGALVRLGRLLWTQLNVKPGDRLRLSRYPAPAPATRLSLRPAFHLSHHLGDHVIEFLCKDETVVWPGATIFAPIFAGGGGVLLRAEGDADAGPVRAGHDTQVTFLDPDPDIARRGVTFAEVGGLDGAISRLRDLIELPLLRPGLYRSLGVRAPKGVILHGPPGTGKTLLSRAVAAELGANVLKMPATELVGTYSGETEANLRSLFSEAAHHAPTLIIIDEIDVIATSRGRLASQGDIRATTQLLTLMDGLEQVDGVVILATTNRLDAMDEAFRRPGRFDEELYIGPPDPAARREILSVHTREMPLTREAEAAFAQVADGRTAGFTGADLMRLARETGLSAARRLAAGGSGLEIAESARDTEVSIRAADVYAGLDRVTPSAMRGMPVPDAVLDWDELDGLDDLKRSVLDAADAALRPGAGRREGVLLTGGSGNGKSAVVQALARRVNANLVVVDGSTIFTQWLGESEAAIRALFGRARDVSPAVVVLEHLDSIAPRRVAGHVESATSRVLSALLSCVDEALGRTGVLVVGVTDRADIIDPALTRAGRLGLHLRIDAPDDARRRQILSRLLTGHPDADLARLVTDTQGLSAAETDRRARTISRQ